jgi:protoheme IX farnesyltransferase
MNQTISSNRLNAYWALCKPRVVALMLLTSIVGMYLASDALVPWNILILGTLGIGLMAGAAATINQVVDFEIDKLMARTQHRPLPTGSISTQHALIFATVLTIAGFWILIEFINTLTALLTFLTLFGYAVFYTMLLKRTTPQNIVIGGIAGATPPLLGWTAVTNSLDPHALLLVLIIFTWTPPHFWALAIHRYRDYAKAKIPMLPITHSIQLTKINILLYTLLLFACSLLPFVVKMNGLIYLAGALILGLQFLRLAIKLYNDPSISDTQKQLTHNNIAIQTFRYSIVYLGLLFIIMLIDHYY